MGERLGRYELIQRLGVGGMGEVWEAVLHGPRGFRRTVALKVLKEGAAASDDLVAEARLGGIVDHPNLVSVLELGQAGGRWFIAMELVRGPTVAHLLRSGPLPPRVVLEIGSQACAALGHVHALGGLVHRDVKPTNLMVDSHGCVRLVDLGIARLAGGPGGAAGTPSYMAPEQHRGEETTASDLFSLGATLYAVATRRRPFGRGHAALEAARDVETLLARPGWLDRADGAVAGLGDVLQRCLRLDPGARWESAAALGAALRRLMVHQPDGATLRDLVVDGSEAPAGLADVVAPPLPTLRRARGPFVGRAEELEALAGALDVSGGLWTLVGPGGVGKTRLAVALGHAVASRLGCSMAFCELADCDTLEDVLRAVAGGLDVPLVGDDPVEQLGTALASRGATVVVLDNVEHLVDGVAHLTPWVDGAPEVRFVATSRRRLGLGAERVHPVGPLPVADGAALFEMLSTRTVTDEDHALVRQLVERLEGLPLAVELAAARSRLLPLPRMISRLDDQLKLLRGGDRDRPERLRSLRASLEVSWRLLQPWERDALSQLSVFRGGWDLEAAEAVVDLQRWPDAPWVLDVLESLLEHSLLQFDEDAERFSTLASVAAWADEHLAPDARGPAEMRHWIWYAQLGLPEALDALRQHGAAPRLLRIRRDRANLVAACQRALEARDPMAAPLAMVGSRSLELGGSRSLALELLERAVGHRVHDVPYWVAHRLVWSLRRQGRGPDAWALLTDVTPPEGADPVNHASWQHTRSILLEMDGRVEQAAAGYRAAAERYEAAGSLVHLGISLSGLAHCMLLTGRVQDAVQVIDAALALHQQQGNALSEAGTLRARGWALGQLGRPAEARAAFEASLALHRRHGNRIAEADLLSFMAAFDIERQPPAEVERVLRQSLAVHTELGVAYRAAKAREYLGIVAAKLGRLDDAVDQLRRAMVVFDAYDRAHLRAACRLNLGQVLLRRGDLDACREVIDAAMAIAEEMGTPRLVGLAHIVLAELALIQGDVPGARAAVEAGDVALQSSNSQTDHAHAALMRGRIAVVEHGFGAALPFFEQADAELQRVGSTLERAEALAWRAEAAFDADAVDEGRRCLRDAGRLAEELQLGPGTWLGERLVDLGERSIAPGP